MRRVRSVVAAVSVAAVAVLLSAGYALSQRGGFRGQQGQYLEPNAAYDGRYTFVRLRYQGGRRSGWSFDYPAMERNFMTIMNDLTSIHPHVRESNVLDMDDPELFKYTTAYLSEPGYWYPSQSEALGLRTWLQKGGFLIVDDFLLNQWTQFEQSMLAVLPDARMIPLSVDHPIFHSFFSIETLDEMYHPDSRGTAQAQYLGIFEDNDASKRLLVIINYNNDIGDYMEWSGEGWYPVNLSNDAYKFATNYIVYGLTR